MQERENKIRSLCVRFNLSKDCDSEVWNILHSLDKKKWNSASRVVINAVKIFFERNARLENDPYFETREREEKFTADIISAVERSMDKEIPKYLAVCIGEILRHYSNGSVPAPAAPAVSVKTEIPEKAEEIIADEAPDTFDPSLVDAEFMGG